MWGEFCKLPKSRVFAPSFIGIRKKDDNLYNPYKDCFEPQSISHSFWEWLFFLYYCLGTVILYCTKSLFVR